MKRFKLFLGLLVAVIVVFVSVGCSPKSEPTVLDAAKAIEQAQAYVDFFVKGEDENATSAVTYDAAMTKAFPQSAMAEVRTSIEADYGMFTEVKGMKSFEQGQYFIVTIGAMYEKKHLAFNVIFNQAGELSGFNYIEIENVDAYFGDPVTSENELRITFGSEEYPLSGVYSKPEGNGPFPAVVLVHGSGPNDMDGTILSNKPYKDIANGLNAQGIAVLRYDKRTLTHAGKLAAVKNFTIFDEVIDDAIYAFEWLSKEESVDSEKIFIIGHSLGANQASRIALLNDKIAGVVLIAGNVTPLHDIMLDQYYYLAELTPGISEEEKKQIDAVSTMVDFMNSEAFGTDSDPALSFGIPCYYWKDLVKYNPIDDALKLKRPILIAQGERDYQVPMTEFALWKNGLGDSAEYLTYPALNHLMIAGSGKPSPEEYSIQGNVDAAFILDVANWIKNQ